MTLVVGLAGCGGPPSDEPEPLEGAALVAGTSLSRHGLLVVPRGGGVPEFRAIDNPSSVRWQGRLSLPPVEAAYSLGGSVLLRHEGGASLYTPSPAETITELPEVPAHARWVGSTGGGAFLAGGWALAVTPSGAREITAEGEILWAAPAAGDRVVALIDGTSGVRLAVWDSEGEPAATSDPIGSRGPAVLSSWGSEVVLASEDGSTIAGWSVPGLERVDEVSVDGPSTALATSPSQHRIFVASGGRARIETIDRYAWRSLGSARVERPLQSLRPGSGGDGVVGYDGSDTWYIPAGSDRAVTIPSEWRADLPIVLPGGSILGVVSGEIRLLSPDGGGSAGVEGPADAWWLPLRWGPRAPITAVAVAEEEVEEEGEAEGTTVRAVGLATLGRVSGQAVAAPPVRPGTGAPGGGFDAAPGTPGVANAVPAGFYAVATSSRQLESLRDLRRALESSGYATQVLPRRDEANDIWYRLMVGPYDSRAAAEGVARELRRQRGIDAWIREVVPGAEGDTP